MATKKKKSKGAVKTSKCQPGKAHASGMMGRRDRMANMKAGFR